MGGFGGRTGHSGDRLEKGREPVFVETQSQAREDGRNHDIHHPKNTWENLWLCVIKTYLFLEITLETFYSQHQRQ